MPKVSIVVPVYNCEKYIARCLDSLICQSLEDIEIVCVNDGSSDSTGEILHLYAQKDSRIKLIEKSNAGASAARNDGVAASSGDFVGFVDSDDMAEKQMFEFLYRAVSENGADLAVCERIRSSEEPHCTYDYVCRIAGEKEIFDINDPLMMGVYITNKLTKREIVLQVPFPENVTFSEDLYVSVGTFALAKKAVFVPLPLYLYFPNPNSLTAEKFSRKALTAMTAQQMTYEFVKSVSGTPHLKAYSLVRLFKAIAQSRFDTLGTELEQEAWEMCGALGKKYFPVLLFGRGFGFKMRLALIVFYLSPAAYKKFRQRLDPDIK